MSNILHSHTHTLRFLVAVSASRCWAPWWRECSGCLWRPALVSMAWRHSWFSQPTTLPPWPRKSCLQVTNLTLKNCTCSGAAVDECWCSRLLWIGERSLTSFTLTLDMEQSKAPYNTTNTQNLISHLLKILFHTCSFRFTVEQWPFSLAGYMVTCIMLYNIFQVLSCLS